MDRAIGPVLNTILEAIDEEEWLDPETERKVWELEASLSEMLKMRGITRYTIPFKDWPEITILHEGTDVTLRQDVLDEQSG